MSNAYGKCRIDNEYCSCQYIGNNVIIKLDCIEVTNEDFVQNLTRIRENYDFSQMRSLNIRNKLINTISNSNVRHICSLNLIHLSMDDNKIKSIERGIFNSMLQLKYLSLALNEIELIEADTFLNEPFESNILELYLSENKLIKIQQKTFNGLFRLQILYIDKNQIEEIEVNSFENLNDLKLLHIHFNKIKIIRSFTFKNLNKLDVLKADNNEIEIVEMNAFKNMTTPKFLHLHSNKIKFLKNEIFFGKTDLEILYLYQNDIENIESIPFNTLRQLKKLHLFSNKIKNIKFGHFVHLQSLDELRLEKNEINSFDSNTFIGLENLVFLDLSANKIRKIVNGAFHALINLKRLSINLNDINELEMNAFADMESLIFLNLASNQISTLKNVQFNSNLVELKLAFNMLSNLNKINSPSIKYLHVSNNRIQEIDAIFHLSNLEYLDLSQNRLISLSDESLKSLKRLKHLNLSSNKLDLENEYKNISYFKGQSLLVTLDLSFNQIKYLDNNFTFKYLSSLEALNLSNNKLKTLDPFVFGYLNKLKELNLASNNLNFLKENCFFNLYSLKSLILSSNRISSGDFLKNNKGYLNKLETLDLAKNNYFSIQDNEFEFNMKLKFINLNSNPIELIRQKAFEKLVFLETLKLSNTKIKNVFLHSNLKELDLGSVNLTITSLEKIIKIEWINLANTTVNCSLGLFLSNFTRYVDFSYNNLNWNEDYKMFKVLGSALETLKLRQTDLQKLDRINLKNLINLKYLDLSFNNLIFVSQDSFEFSLNLEYLDLSSNYLYEFSVVLSKLRYLNLDNNQINSTNEVLKDYNLIEIFKMANNRLKKYPSFEMTEINSDNSETFLEFHLNQNQINEIKYFPFIFGRLILADFDSNNISSIENDAFLNLRSLEYLSISNNWLTNLTENNFHFLFSLIQLNLSFNEISFIEKNSFKNLNKLKSLDLNYNKMISIENDLFFGLINLNDLYLLSQNEITFYNQSFQHLPNISTIFLNEILIYKYKCLFMHNLERDIQRNVANKYVFYKSINLITLDFSFHENLNSKCDLMLHLFQFKIHFNLKTDNDIELFYDSCQKVLIKRENNFNHSKRICIANFDFRDKEDGDQIHSLHPILKVLSNFYYMLSIALILSLLVPAIFMVFRYELFPDLISKLTRDSSSHHSARVIKNFEKKMQRNRAKLDKAFQNLSNFNKKNSLLIQKIEEDFLIIKKKYLEFQSRNSQHNIIANINKIKTPKNDLED